MESLETLIEEKLFFFKSDSLGGGGEIGVRLLEVFWGILRRSSRVPKMIVLIKIVGALIAQNSANNIENFNTLRILEKRGVCIVASQSCLEHFNLSLSMGEARDSNQILQAMLD